MVPVLISAVHFSFSSPASHMAVRHVGKWSESDPWLFVSRT